MSGGAAELKEDDAGEEATVWRSAIKRARRATVKDDDAALVALDDELLDLMKMPRPLVRRALPRLALYRSLIEWKRHARFTAPFENIQTARIQFWELDTYSSDLEYLRYYVAEAVNRFPTKRGFASFQRVLSTIRESRSGFKLSGTDVQVHRRPGATITIVCFADINGKYPGMGWALFERAVAEPLNANLILLRDSNKRIYLAGIESLGDYPASVNRLRDIIGEFADTRVVATGGSGGVFGAINFSADLGIRHVVAVAGPTSIEVGEDNEDRVVYRRITADIEAGRFPRVDLAAKVNASPIEQIDFFVAGQKAFDMEQLHALQRQSSKVRPHVYEELDSHIIVDYAVEDGSLLAAFKAGPSAKGLAPPSA